MTFCYYFRDRKELTKKCDLSAIVKSNVVNEVLSRSTFSRDSLARLFARTIFEWGVDGRGIKMSIRCAFRSLVSRSFNLLLGFASSRLHDRPLVRKLHLSNRGGAYSLALAFITLFFFPLPRGATKNRKHAVER